uniref:Uncharacterized protein n=1 Tax=Rhizobium rhizogenes TaxID=359 RepID=A0A7S5DR71_RHIRH|nr:hypothetical protein C6.5e_747 [Rhizobium rhizogenes]
MLPKASVAIVATIEVAVPAIRLRRVIEGKVLLLSESAMIRAPIQLGCG